MGLGPASIQTGAPSQYLEFSISPPCWLFSKLLVGLHWQVFTIILA